MNTIGLIDFDSKIPNLAIMKLSTYYKQHGVRVILNPQPGEVDKVFCSVIFSWSKEKALALQAVYPNIEFGGSGISLENKLPEEIESLPPDYDLYTVEDLYPRITGQRTKGGRIKKAQSLIDQGMNYISRGCIRDCRFCIVRRKEGKLNKVNNLSDIINPRSKQVMLLDNNLTANPDILDILAEVKDRDLTINISQGIDCRLLTPEIAKALSDVKHVNGRIHYAWDRPRDENIVMDGIRILSEHMKTWRHTVYILCGFDTTWEEDFHRFDALRSLGITPFVMRYNRGEGQYNDLRLAHFARWVNRHIYKKCPEFDKYENWANIKDQYALGL
jgi:hypothetical protein